MKARIFLLIAIVILMFTSCKKGITDEVQNQETKIADFVKQEVIGYVLSKRVKGDKDLNNAIDTVLGQINWSNYKIVYNEAGHKLTLIELSSFSENKLMMLLYTNKGKTGYNGLHLVTAKKQPTSKISEMDAIALLHQGKEHTFTGAISYFKITKQFIYETGYENGEKKYFKTLGDKNDSVSGEATTEACYEVYLVTYWSDGSITYDYMYSFCDTGGGDGDCHQQRVLNFSTASASNGLRCGPWSGSGGGGNDYAFELPTEQRDWNVASGPSWLVTSTEQFKGIDDPSNGGKQFTGITHLGDNGYALSDEVNVVWYRQGVTTTLINILIARCQISGKLSVTDTGIGTPDPNDLFIDKPIINHKLWNSLDIW